MGPMTHLLAYLHLRQSYVKARLGTKQRLEWLLVVVEAHFQPQL
jgi:hypothetical protein